MLENSSDTNMPPLVAATAAEPLPLKGGDDPYSYCKNSDIQSVAANSQRDKVEEEIIQNLDVKYLSLVSNNTIRLAYLGCATGPNTFITRQYVLEAIKQNYYSQWPNSPHPPEFQVFFNDRTLNDFNTLFASIPPNQQYFCAGVPGSFHDRLFPKSSLHFVYTSYALHWLSKLPEELLDKDSPASNKGRIHYFDAPLEVCNAYETQFFKDIETFLSHRAMEIVPGGMMFLLIGGRPNGKLSADSQCLGFEYVYSLMGSSLYELAKEGLIDEALVDSLNIPIYFPSPEEIIGLVKRNGHYTIERIQLSNPTYLKDPIDIEQIMMHLRASGEGVLSRHFGSETIDKVFERIGEKARENSKKIESNMRESFQLFIALMRK